MTNDISKLIGKPIDQLSPRELAELQSSLNDLARTLATREQELKAEATNKAFATIAEVAKAEMEKLGWQKLPPLHLVAQDDNTYKVDYVATTKKTKTKTKSSGGNGNGRRVLGINEGKITVRKIGEMLGGIAKFRLPDGREFDNIRSVVIDGLGYSPDDKSHSFSYRLTDEHPEVILILTNGQEITVGDAVERMKKSRQSVAAAATA